MKNNFPHGKPQSKDTKVYYFKEFLYMLCKVGICLLYIAVLPKEVLAKSSSHASISLPIISRLESSGCPNPCIGDHGKGFGPFQIHPELVTDFNRVHAVKYSHEDMFDFDKACQVAEWAFNHYFPLILGHLKKPVSTKNLLTCWNAGCGAGFIPKAYIEKYYQAM